MVKKAFTLAEVLITLAIIGVVAALTIPTLITNYQKDQYVTQLKKAYTTLENGFKTAMATDGVLKLSDTNIWRSINGDDTRAGDQSAVQAELSKIFNIIQHYNSSDITTGHPLYIKYSLLTGDGSEDEYIYDNSFVLADGAVVTYYFMKDPHWSENPVNPAAQKAKNLKFLASSGGFYIDVNGPKGPNKYGRDLFSFSLGDNGVLYPFGGLEYSYYDAGDDSLLWSGVEKLCHPEEANCRGDGCAARIIEEGWKMNY